MRDQRNLTLNEVYPDLVISEKAIQIYTWVVFAAICNIINIFGITTNIINIMCFLQQGLKESVITSVGLEL